MVRQKLQTCTTCGAHGLSTTCIKCGKPAQAAAPLKWSPDDHQASRRRERHSVESKEWVEKLPQAIQEASLEEE